MVVSLNDYNQKQLRDIAAERDQLLRDFDEKKAGRATTKIILLY